MQLSCFYLCELKSTQRWWPILWSTAMTGAQKNNGGRSVQVWVQPRNKKDLLRWERSCIVEMLICYSVCLWQDEKHSHQIHWRRGILKRDCSCCWLAWQQSRALQLHNAFQKAVMTSVFSLNGEDEKLFVLLICSIFTADIGFINNARGKEYVGESFENINVSYVVQAFVDSSVFGQIPAPFPAS